MEWLISGVNSVLAIGVVLGLCLFFHEAGHFLAAKAFRMRVHQFGLGFGPAIWKRRIGETLYSIRLAPLGGFVQIAGMDGEDRNVPDSFYSRPRWQGAIVICAGVFMNIVLAVLVYWAVNVGSGMPIPGDRSVVIRKVFRGGPAESAGIQPNDEIIGLAGSHRSLEVADVTAGSVGEKMGLKPGSRIFQIGDKPVAVPADVLRLLRDGLAKNDRIWAINGEAQGIEDAVIPLNAPDSELFASVPENITNPEADLLLGKLLGVRFASMDQFTAHRFISARPGETIDVSLLRGGETLALQLKLASDTDRVEMVAPNGKLTSPHRTVGRIGITLGPDVKPTGILYGLQLALVQSYNAVATVFVAFKAMVLGKIAAEPAGPIGIMAMTAERAKLGWASVLSLCGLISANLAVINMLPMPPFDGGHILLMSVESVLNRFGRRLDERFEMLVRVAGLIIVVNVFVLLTYKDIANLVKYGTY
jgi:regulator of sigma E protease